MPEKQELSRLERFYEAGVDVDWPELKLQYLFEYLMRIGPCFNTGMGQEPLNWTELEAWQKVNGITLTPWELSIIRKASIVYVEQVQLSRKADCVSPIRLIEQDPDKFTNHIKNILR